MKKILLIQTVFLFLTVAHIRSNAQVPNWLWAKSAAGSGIETGRSVATDAAGNVVAIGEFGTPSMTFGTTVLTNAGLLSTNSRDIFIVKYDSVGNMLWVKSAGGDGEDYASSICTDAIGNIFVTGNFGSDSISFGTTTLFNDTVWSMFVVKYDPSGNVLWAKTAKATWTNDGTGISTDAAGNVVVTGSFYAPWVAFGSDTLTSAGGQDFFVVKYNSAGNFLWAESGGGSSTDFSKSVSVDADGNILVTGYFQSPSISFGTITLSNAGNADVFIVKYDALGNVLWAKSSGGSDDESGTSIFTDSANNVLVTGYFESNSITFGTTTLTNYSYSSLFLPTDLFLVKYDSGGNLLWAKRAGGFDDERGNGITCDLSGNIFVTGSFTSDSISFGAITLYNSSQEEDIFVVKYTVSGNEEWATSVGGPGIDAGVAIATDAGGHTMVTGLFGIPSASFGTTILNNTGYQDFFVAKLNASGTSGINEFSKNDFEIRTFPNPFSFSTTLQTDNFLNNATLTLYNSFGQTVKRIDNLSGQTIIFHRDNLPSGLYFIRITQDNKAISADKLVIID